MIFFVCLELSSSQKINLGLITISGTRDSHFELQCAVGPHQRAHRQVEERQRRLNVIQISINTSFKGTPESLFFFCPLHLIRPNSYGLLACQIGPFSRLVLAPVITECLERTGFGAKKPKIWLELALLS